MKYLLFTLTLFSSVSLCGCNQSSVNTQETDTDSTQPEEDLFAKPKLKKTELVKFDPTKKSDKEKRLNESLFNAYAQDAAASKTICPKLLVRDVDKQTIKRVGDKLQGNSCDYYLYPIVGQSIRVWSESSDVNIRLIAPEGSDLLPDKPIKVKSDDRHIIRVKYKEPATKPEDFTYNLAVDFDIND